MKHFVTALLLFLVTNLVAQSVQFKREYNLAATTYSTRSGDLYQMPDSGFIFTSGSGQWPDSAVVLTRTDKWGVPQWNKIFHLTEYYDNLHLIKHNINRYTIFAGHNLICVDSSGNTQWSMTLDDEFVNCAPTKNNGLILQGQYYDTAAEYMMSVLKLDSAGNVVWSTAVDSLLNNGVQGVVAVPTPNGREEYVLIGTCYTEYNNYSVVTFISEDGTLLWNKLTLSYLILDLAVTPDSGILLNGISLFPDSVNPGTGINVHKMRYDGVSEYLKCFGPLSASWCKVEISADTILLCGMFADPNYFGQVYSIALDTAMNIFWKRRVSGGANTNFDPTCSYLKTSDGGYAQLTTRNTSTNNQYKLFLTKANSVGNGLCNEYNFNLSMLSIPWSHINDSVVRPYTANTSVSIIPTDTIDMTSVSICSSVGFEETLSTENWSVWPNPADNQLTMEFNTITSTENEVRIYNTQGSEVMFFVASEKRVQIDVAELPAGLYVVSVNGSFSELKLVITR